MANYMNMATFSYKLIFFFQDNLITAIQLIQFNVTITLSHTFFAIIQDSPVSKLTFLSSKSSQTNRGIYFHFCNITQ